MILSFHAWRVATPAPTPAPTHTHTPQYKPQNEVVFITSLFSSISLSHRPLAAAVFFMREKSSAPQHCVYCDSPSLPLSLPLCLFLSSQRERQCVCVCEKQRETRTCCPTNKTKVLPISITELLSTHKRCHLHRAEHHARCFNGTRHSGDVLGGGTDSSPPPPRKAPRGVFRCSLLFLFKRRGQRFDAPWR